MNNHITRVPSEIDAIKATAESGQDSPVLMLNLNRDTVAAGYPNGDEYQTYMAQLEESVGRVGGKVLWRTPVAGQPVGCEHDGVERFWLSGTQATHRSSAFAKNQGLRRCTGYGSYALPTPLYTAALATGFPSSLSANRPVLQSPPTRHIQEHEIDR